MKYYFFSTFSSKTASEWKPSFLSDEEFLHLMLESVDGFVLIINICDNGRILYASEGITWLLGHVPNTLVDRNVSIFDLLANEDINALKAALNDKVADADEVCDLFLLSLAIMGTDFLAFTILICMYCSVLISSRN